MTSAICAEQRRILAENGQSTAHTKEEARNFNFKALEHFSNMPPVPDPATWGLVHVNLRDGNGKQISGNDWRQKLKPKSWQYADGCNPVVRDQPLCGGSCKCGHP